MSQIKEVLNGNSLLEKADGLVINDGQCWYTEVINLKVKRIAKMTYYTTVLG